MEKITKEQIRKILWNTAHKNVSEKRLKKETIFDGEAEAIFSFIRGLHTNDLIQPIIEHHKKREGIQLNEPITQREANLIVLCLEQFDTMLGK
jgi:hypothetical protein